jgi:AcrR family transcriptional regulator
MKAVVTKPKPTDAARAKIVAGARKHFLASGFRSVTMDDLAEELGMSKKTLYAHFPSKTGLVEAVMQDKVSSIDADLEAVSAAENLSFATSLHQLLACAQKHLDEIQPVFLRDIRRDAPEVFAAIEERRSTMIQHHFGRVLGQGRKDGMIRKDVPMRLIVEVLLGATRAIMNPQKLGELGITPKAGYAGIITLLLQGALTEKGRTQL